MSSLRFLREDKGPFRAGGPSGPRERLLRDGAGALTDEELLAVLLRTGCEGRDVVAVAGDLLQRTRGSLLALLHAGPSLLTSIKGVKGAKAASLLAGLELARRAMAEEHLPRPCVREPEDVTRYLHGFFRGRDREILWAVFLDQRHRILDHRVLTEGTLSQAVIYPREVVKMALEVAAAAVIVAHNHPSGDPSPSADDRRITRLLQNALQAVDIALLDHLIIGAGSHVSLSRLGWLAG